MQKLHVYIGVAAIFLVPNFAFAFDHSHAPWSDFLRKYIVTEGASSYVNYAEIQKSPSDIKEYLATLEKVSSLEFRKFSESEQLALLINAYNALTIKLVLDYYPVSSIRDIKGDFATPWDKKFFSLLGTRRSLNELEHEIIRKKYNEPRIHFALVCAARGCPALKDEAYQSSRLNEQLDRSAAAFLADRSRNFYDSKTKTIHLSELFSWYKSDFTKSHDSLPAFVAKYMPELVESNHAQLNVDFSKNKYDWGLNDTSTKRGPASLLVKRLPDSVLDQKNTEHSRNPSPSSGVQGQYGPPAPNSSEFSPSGSGTGSRPSYSAERGGGGGIGSGTELSGPNGTAPSISGPSPSSDYAGPGSEPKPPPAPSGPSVPPGSGTETPSVSTPTAGSGTESGPDYGQGSAESRKPVGSRSESSRGNPAVGSGTESYRPVGSGTESVGIGTESVGSGTESYRSGGSSSETYGSIGSGTETSDNFKNRGRLIGGTATENVFPFDGASRSFSIGPSSRGPPHSAHTGEIPSIKRDAPLGRNNDRRDFQSRTVSLDLTRRDLPSRQHNTTSSSRMLSTRDSHSESPRTSRTSGTRIHATREPSRVRAEIPLASSGRPIGDEFLTSDKGVGIRGISEASDREPTADISPIKSPVVTGKEKIPPNSKNEKLISVADKKPRQKVIAVKLPVSRVKKGQQKDQLIYIEQDTPLSQEQMKAMIKEVIEVLKKLGRVEKNLVKEIEAVATVSSQEKLDRYPSVMISISRERKKVFIPTPEEELASDTGEFDAEKLRKKRDASPASVTPAI